MSGYNDLCDKVCSFCGSSPLVLVGDKSSHVLKCVNCKAVKCRGQSQVELHNRFHDMGVDPNSSNFTERFFNLKGTV